MIQGEARGADLIGKAWAIRRHVDHIDMPAAWTTHAEGWCAGKWCAENRRSCLSAGAKRNQEMIDRALEVAGEQFVFAFKDRFRRGETGGTEDLVRRAQAAGIHGLVISHHPRAA